MVINNNEKNGRNIQNDNRFNVNQTMNNNVNDNLRRKQSPQNNQLIQRNDHVFIRNDIVCNNQRQHQSQNAQCRIQYNQNVNSNQQQNTSNALCPQQTNVTQSRQLSTLSSHQNNELQQCHNEPSSKTQSQHWQAVIQQLASHMPPLISDGNTNLDSITNCTNNNSNNSLTLSNDNTHINNYRFSQNNINHNSWLGPSSNVSQVKITNVTNYDDTEVTTWLKSLVLQKQNILIFNFYSKGYRDLNDIMNLRRDELYPMFGEIQQNGLPENYCYDDLLTLFNSIRYIKEQMMNECKNKLLNKFDETKKMTIKQCSNVNDCKKSIIKMKIKHESNVSENEVPLYNYKGKFYKRNDIILYKDDNTMKRQLLLNVYNKSILATVIGKKITGKTKLIDEYLIECPMSNKKISCIKGIIARSLASHLKSHPEAQNEGYDIPNSYASIVHLY